MEDWWNIGRFLEIHGIPGILEFHGAGVSAFFHLEMAFGSINSYELR